MDDDLCIKNQKAAQHEVCLQLAKSLAAAPPIFSVHIVIPTSTGGGICMAPQPLVHLAGFTHLTS